MGSEENSRSGLSVVTRGTLVYFVATLVLIAATFAWRVILVRTLSPEGWDAFSDAIAIASSIATVAGLGLQNTIARNLPYSQTDPERRAIVRVGLIIGGISCAALPVALYFAGPAIGAATGSTSVGLGVQVLGLAFGLSSAVALFASVFQGFEDVWPSAIFAQMLGPALFVGLLFGTYILGGRTLSFDSAVWSYAVAWGTMFVLIVVYTLRRLPRRLPGGPHTPGRTVPLMLFALPLLGVAVFGFLNGYADTIILGVFDFSQVGTYVASLTLARLLPIGITALSYIMLPVTARLLRAGDRSAAGLTYSTATKWTALFGLPLFLLFAFVPGPSLDLVYGPGYDTITIPLVVVATGGFLSTIVGPATAVQISVGQTRLLFVNASVSLAVDVLVALWLVPGYGMTGAALAWASATIIYPVLAIVELATFEQIHPFQRTYVVPFLATAIPCAIALALVPSGAIPLWFLPVLGVLLALVYVGMIFATKSVDSGDLLLLDIVERLVRRPFPSVRRWMARASRPRK